MLVVVVLALSAYRFTQSMAAEYRVADGLERTAQAQAFARSAIDYSMVMLSNPQNFSTMVMYNPYDNSAIFQHIIVQPNDKPRFQAPSTSSLRSASTPRKAARLAIPLAPSTNIARSTSTHFSLSTAAAPR